MGDISFTLPNGLRGTMGEDGKIAILGKAPTGAEGTRLPSSQEKSQTDDELGIESPPDYGKDALGRQRAAPVKPHTTDPMEADPIAQGVVGGVLGAGAGAVAGPVVGAIAPRAAPFLAGAANGATQTAVQGGSPKQIALGGAVGGVLGAGTQAKEAIGNAAQERIDERIPTAITGGTRTKAAKKVIQSSGNGVDDTGGALLETVNAHPELKEVLANEQDHALRAGAVSATKAKLNAETLKDFAAVDAQKGGFPADEVIANLKNLSRNSTSPSTREAARNIAGNIAKEYGENGKIPALHLRDYRNELGSVAFKTPAVDAASVPIREKALREAHSAINDAIEDTMSETHGVDVPAFKTRNRQVSTLIPVETSIREQAAAAAAKGPHGELIEDLRHPTAAIAKRVIQQGPSVIDRHLATLAGASGANGVAALKAVALNPSAATLRAAVQAGVTPAVALQVARLGAAQPAVAQ